MVSLRTLAIVVALVAAALAVPQYHWGRSRETLPLAWGSYYDYSNEHERESGSDEMYEIEVPLARRHHHHSKQSNNWQKGGVDAINEFRSQANLPPYKHDPKLSQGAQQWADYMAENCKYDHSDTSTWGDANFETLADLLTFQCTEASTCAKAGIGQWMDEKKVYDCQPLTYKDTVDSNSARFQYFENVGHFMALMDKTKTAAGLGFARGRGKCKDDQYLVGRFSGQDMKYYGPELKNAGGDDNMVNTAAFVPCPN